MTEATRFCTECGATTAVGVKFCGSCGHDASRLTGSVPESHGEEASNVPTSSRGSALAQLFALLVGALLLVGYYTGASEAIQRRVSDESPLTPREWAGAVAALVDELPVGPLGPAPSSSMEEILWACTQLGDTLDAYGDDVARAPTPGGREEAANALRLFGEAKAACAEWKSRPASRALFDEYIKNKLAGMDMLTSAVESVTKGGFASEDAAITQP